MARSTRRAALTTGLGMGGLLGLAGRAPGDEPPHLSDWLRLAARNIDRHPGKAAPAIFDEAEPPAPEPPAVAPPIPFGTIDLEAVMKGYRKVEAFAARFKRDVAAKEADLGRLGAEGNFAVQTLAGLPPGSPEAKDLEKKIGRLKVQLESEREEAKADFAQREAESLARFYGEIQEATAAVARERGLAYVVRSDRGPVPGIDPAQVMAAMSRAFVYADPRADITEEVIARLNRA